DPALDVRDLGAEPLDRRLVVVRVELRGLALAVVDGRSLGRLLGELLALLLASERGVLEPARRLLEGPALPGHGELLPGLGLIEVEGVLAEHRLQLEDLPPGLLLVDGRPLRAELAQVLIGDLPRQPLEVLRPFEQTHDRSLPYTLGWL